MPDRKTGRWPNRADVLWPLHHALQARFARYDSHYFDCSGREIAHTIPAARTILYTCARLTAGNAAPGARSLHAILTRTGKPGTNRAPGFDAIIDLAAGVVPPVHDHLARSGLS